MREIFILLIFVFVQEILGNPNKFHHQNVSLKNSELISFHLVELSLSCGKCYEPSFVFTKVVFVYTS